jgi:hypothetical protein
MQNQKKMYQAPKVVVHGSVAELTLVGGGASIDLPLGSPDPATISAATVTGYVSKP